MQRRSGGIRTAFEFPYISRKLVGNLRVNLKSVGLLNPFGSGVALEGPSLFSFHLPSGTLLKDKHNPST